MKLFIEKEFLDSFSKIIKDNPLHNDVTKFFLHLKNFTLVTNYKADDIYNKEKYKENDLLECIINNNPKIEYIDDLTSVTDYPFSLYFINKNSKDCKDLSENTGFEFICIENIEERWKIYYSERDDKLRKVTKDKSINETQRFDCWEILQKYKHPYISLLIFDDYVLTDKSNQKITDNLFQLLKNFISIVPKKNKIQITIIAENNKIRNDNNLESIHNEISNFLKVILKGNNFKLNIIKHDKSLYPQGFEGIKPRRIYTNYFQIKPEGSLNFFKSNGQISNSFDITFNFNFQKENWALVKKELKDIKTYIDNIDSIKHFDMMYYPDKENALLEL